MRGFRKIIQKRYAIALKPSLEGLVNEVKEAKLLELRKK